MAEHIDVSGSISVPKRQHGYMFPCIRCTWPSTYRLLSRPRLPPSPTEHTPSRSSCSFIRPQAALHLRAVSMPYLHRHLRHPSAKARSPGQNERPSAHRAEGLFGVGIYLLSRAASSQVSSTRVSLTAVFGMGTGVPSPSSTPTICGYHRRYLPAHHGAIP